MDDAQIIELYFARNERAISETIAKYGAYCFAVASRILSVREDAEECVSDTWVHTWNAVPPSRPRIFKAFLAKITRNLSINRYEALHAVKRGAGETALVLDELAEVVGTGNAVEDAVLTKELSALIGDFVQGLPGREALIFTRRYFFTEAVCDIAARFDLSENNVSVILNRTRRKLKGALHDAGYDV